MGVFVLFLVGNDKFMENVIEESIEVNPISNILELLLNSVKGIALLHKILDTCC